jgi:magnesium transporter
LLRYEDDTAGGIMVPDFIALREDLTVREAITSLQKEHQDVEMPFYLYVVDEYGNLVGVSSLRQLVVFQPETALRDFMTTEVFSVTTDTDQEEVAKIVAKYDILAVPVVNETNKLVGIVTVDDVIDIFREEATEDILKMAGVGGEEFVETKSILRSTRIRLPWLFASWYYRVFYHLPFREQPAAGRLSCSLYPRYHGNGRKHRNPVLHHRSSRTCHGPLECP